MGRKDIEILESRIFEYFLEELECSLKDKDNASLREALRTYSDSDSLNSYIHINYFAEKILTPEFGITLRDILSALKENKTTFKNYVINIMTKPEFNLQEELARDGYRFEEGLEELVSSLTDDTNGSMSADDGADPEEIKKKLIQGSLGNENINLDDLSDEELDALLAKTIRVESKVNTIRNYLKEKGMSDNDTVAKYISHYTGMHIKEALEIIEEDW